MPKKILPDRVYDVLKWVAIIALPAFSIFYARIGAVWQLPYTEQICETLDAVAVLLGALLCVSAIQYATDKAAEGNRAIARIYWRRWITYTPTTRRPNNAKTKRTAEQPKHYTGV